MGKTDRPGNLDWGDERSSEETIGTGVGGGAGGCGKENGFRRRSVIDEMQGMGNSEDDRSWD